MSYTLKNLPLTKDFQKKYTLLLKFIIELDYEVLKLSEDKKIFCCQEEFVYMKQWLRTKHAVMFALSNKIFQVAFFDGTQILLNTFKKTVLFSTKKNQNVYQTLASALHAEDSEMAKRIRYTKKILNSIDNFP
jgi:polo-like kinase 1